MPVIPPELLGGLLKTLFAATAPAQPETQDALAARRHTLAVALAAFQPESMQEALLAMQILAAHWVTMVRFSQANQAELGSMQASRLLRDAVAAQRLQLAATRSLRLCRSAEARIVRRRQQEVYPSASARPPVPPPEPAQTTPQPAPAPAASGAEPPLPTGQPPAARPAQPLPRPATAPLPRITPDAPIPSVLPAVNAGSVPTTSYKAALRSSAAVLPTAA